MNRRFARISRRRRIGPGSFLSQPYPVPRQRRYGGIFRPVRFLYAAGWQFDLSMPRFGQRRCRQSLSRGQLCGNNTHRQSQKRETVRSRFSARMGPRVLDGHRITIQEHEIHALFLCKKAGSLYNKKIIKFYICSGGVLHDHITSRPGYLC